MGSPAVTSFGSGAFLLGKQRKFWFQLDAELIVYGATEPTARVTLQGEPVKLRPDGTFTMLNVPDGRYTLQVREVGGLAGATVPVAPTSAPIASGAKIFGQADVVVSNRDVENVIVAVRSPPTLKGRILIETSAQRRSTIDPSRIQIALLPEQRAVGAALVRVPRADGTFDLRL